MPTLPYNFAPKTTPNDDDTDDDTDADILALDDEDNDDDDDDSSEVHLNDAEELTHFQANDLNLEIWIVRHIDGDRLYAVTLTEDGRHESILPEGVVDSYAKALIIAGREMMNRPGNWTSV